MVTHVRICSLPQKNEVPTYVARHCIVYFLERRADTMRQCKCISKPGDLTYKSPNAHYTMDDEDE